MENRKAEYRANPCGTLSIPWWKSQAMTMPDWVRVFHARDFAPEMEPGCGVTRYFRLKHDLCAIPRAEMPLDTIDLANQCAELSSMIQASYLGQGVGASPEDVLAWRDHPTYRPELCVCVRVGGQMVGSGIAEYDPEFREGILEWIQVLPEYRRMGYGQAVVAELLQRLKALGAEFATVAGSLDNAANPEALYRACGFTGNDVWYVAIAERREGT